MGPRGTAPVTSLSYSELKGGTKGNSSCYFLELQRCNRWDQGEQLLLLPRVTESSKVGPRETAPVTSLSYSELKGGTKGNSSCYFLELQRGNRWDQGEQLLLLP